MSSKWQPGQLLFAGFEGLELPEDLARLIAAGRVGGVVLFARNVGDPDQVQSLNAALHACAPEGAPLLIAIDQEGGRIQRLRDPWTQWPPMQRLGEADDLEMTAAVARALAVELSNLGIGLDFAPCVDVDTNPANPIASRRAWPPMRLLSFAPCRTPVSPLARSTSPATVTPPATATSNCHASTTTSRVCTQWSCLRSALRSRLVSRAS